MDAYYSVRPLNFAHRGACNEAPENTLAAFRRAVDLGADGIELDVQLSADGEVVVIHDFSLETTTNGKGSVRDKTLAELRELDAGATFDPSFSGQRIPTLQEVVDAVGDHLLLNIELKTEETKDSGLAAAVVRIIEENGLLDRAVLSSFNPLAVWRAKRLNPRVPAGLLYAPDSPFLLRRPWPRHFMHLEALHPYHADIDVRYMDWARKRGYRIHTWTVDEPDRMRALMLLGVDIIITNLPDLLSQVLAAGPGEQSSSAQTQLAADAEGV
jgi:glycerophosphoryl diester phosphodiesterase